MRLSPTAIKLFAECPRAWRYSRDERAPQKKSAALGDRIHLTLQKYAIGEGFKLASKESRIVFPGLKHVPEPGPANECEVSFSYAGPPGITYNGKIDLRRRPLVIDHKSTQSIDEYALTEEQFPDDTQRVIYADSLSEGAIVVPKSLVTTRWIYYQTIRPYRSETRELTEPLSDARERRVALVDPIAIEMAATVGDPPTSFARNLGHCGAYGGCFYKPRCYAAQPPTLEEQIRGSAMASPMLERLRAKQNASAAAQTQTTDLSGPADESEAKTEPKAEEPAPSGPRLPPLKRTTQKPEPKEDAPARGNVQAPVSGEILVTELGGFVQSLLDAAMDAADAGEDYRAQSLVVAAAVMRKRGAA